MSKELDIRIAVENRTPDIQIEMGQQNPDVRIAVEKGGSIIGDYETLRNLPQVNGVVLIGNQTSQDLRVILTDTRANWDAKIQFIPEAGQIVVYSDYYGEDRPAAKIGDGSAYLIDLPIVGEGMTAEITQALAEHTQNAEVHVTSTKKAFWNNKLNVQVSGEIMILNRD